MKTTLSDSDRVRRNTCPAVNNRIEQRIHRSLQRHVGQPTQALSQQIRKIDREWDIERTLEANAAIVGLAGFVAGVTVHRKWLALPAAVLGFLLMHAVQGWCPPVPLFRRLGVRTRREIERERYGLKTLRGDFARVDRRDVDGVRLAVGR